jgi:hypothetical protein
MLQKFEIKAIHFSPRAIIPICFCIPILPTKPARIQSFFITTKSLMAWPSLTGGTKVFYYQKTVFIHVFRPVWAFLSACGGLPGGNIIDAVGEDETRGKACFPSGLRREHTTGRKQCLKKQRSLRNLRLKTTAMGTLEKRHNFNLYK